MHFNAAIYIKGDWSEFNGTFGFPAWNDNMRPCFRCPADLDSLYKFRPISALCCGTFIENRVNDYFDACDTCEHHCVIDKSTHAQLLLLLFYDKRDDGSHGLSVGKPGIPQRGIPAGARVEPSHALPNVGLLFNTIFMRFSRFRLLFGCVERKR